MKAHPTRPAQWLILCIHEVTRARHPNSPWSISYHVLDDLLHRLQAAGWTATSPDSTKPAPIQGLLLCLDDARSGALDWLATSETAAGIRATVFPVPQFIEQPESIPASERYSGFGSWEQLHGVLDQGHAVGSHGLTHSSLNVLRSGGLRRELDESKRILEQRFQRSIVDLALPYGRYNDSVLIAGRRAGYRRIYTTRPGLVDCSDMASGLLRRNVVRTDQENLGIHPEVITP